MSDEKRSEERRAQPRQSVLFRTVLIDSEIEGEAAEIINIARLGFLARTPRGRVVTPLAYQHLGFPVPSASTQPTFFGQ